MMSQTYSGYQPLVPQYIMKKQARFESQKADEYRSARQMQNMFENFTKPPKFMAMKQNRISRRYNLVKSLDYKSGNQLARTQQNFLEIIKGTSVNWSSGA